MYGISASFYTTIYSNVFEPDGLSFMLFMMVSVLALGLAALPFFNAVPFRQAQECPGKLFRLVSVTVNCCHAGWVSA